MNRTIGAISLLMREYDEAVSFYVNKPGFTPMEDSDRDRPNAGSPSRLTTQPKPFDQTQGKPGSCPPQPPLPIKTPASGTRPGIASASSSTPTTFSLSMRR